MSDTFTVDETSADVDTTAPEVTTEVETTEATAVEQEAPVADEKPAGKAQPRDLESDLKTVLDGLVTGKMQLPDGKKATPHVLARMIQGIRGGDKTDLPSSGAVSDALTRWATIGYVTLGSSPLSFEDYTDAGRQEGLTALKAAHRARLAAARLAAKAAIVQAAPAPEPEVESEPVASEPELEQPAVVVVDDRPPF